MLSIIDILTNSLTNNALKKCREISSRNIITVTTTIATIMMMIIIKNLHEKQTVLSNHTFHKNALKTKCVEQFLN